MQIVSNGDNLHEMPNPVFWENKKNISLSFAEFAHRMVKAKPIVNHVCIRKLSALSVHRVLHVTAIDFNGQKC